MRKGCGLGEIVNAVGGRRDNYIQDCEDAKCRWTRLIGRVPESHNLPMPRLERSSSWGDILWTMESSGSSVGLQRSSGPVRRIVLTGFMGSGKSTVGPLVAARLGWRFVDADDAIVERAGMPISDIFATQGEAAFRRMESETIARLAAEDNLVLALGGGAIEDAESRRLLLEGPGTLLVHLEVRLDTALARCSGTDGSRPVLADRANLQARYDRRVTLYREAHVSIAADRIEAHEVAEAVVRAAGAPGLL